MKVPNRPVAFVPVCLILMAMISIQCSASFAKTLFALTTPQGVTALRLGISALILLMVFRPWRRKVPVGAWRHIIAYGMALGCMNLSFYMAIQLIPLGVAVALEFCGPLALAMFSSRRLLDFVWITLAVFGVLTLLPLGPLSSGVDPVGCGFALGAGLCWALYIVFGKKAGAINGTSSVALGTFVAALLIFPVGLVSAGSQLFSPALLPGALLIGVFSSALPYGLEMVALEKLPAQTFGILMSLEPALAALSGFLFLQEHLSLLQWMALACVTTASIGATVTLRRA